MNLQLILPTRYGFLKNAKLAVNGKFAKVLPVHKDEVARHY